MVRERCGCLSEVTYDFWLGLNWTSHPGQFQIPSFVPAKGGQFLQLILKQSLRRAPVVCAQQLAAELHQK